MRLLSRLEYERSFGARWSTYFVRLPYALGCNPWTASIGRIVCTRKAKAQVVVAVVGLPVVAIRRTAVLGVVVPAAATPHPVGARLLSAQIQRISRHGPPQMQGTGMAYMRKQAGDGNAQVFHAEPACPVSLFPTAHLPV